MFEEQGVDGLRLRHIGSVGYLNWQQRVAVIDWLKQKNYWNLPELQTHIEEQYGVVFESNQSYYNLFAQAGISWKKTQRSNPKKDPQRVEKKHDIMTWLESHRQEIEAGKLVVFLLDECHLLWGDVCGYVWGKTNERIEVPIVSDRQRQTYFGALNYSSKEFVVKFWAKFL